MTHFKRAGLVFAIQIICTAGVVRWQNTDLDWLAGAFFYSTLIIPLIGYIAVFYKAPMFEKTPSIAKMICLALLSFVGTMGGSMMILVLFAVVGVPMRD